MADQEFTDISSIREDDVVVNGVLGVTEDLNVGGISIRQMAETLARIDARTAQIERTLNSLFQFTARHPDGRSLVNVVGSIENVVKSIEDEVT